MKRKILGIILAAVMAVTTVFGICGTTFASGTVRIAILRNLWTDRTGTAIERYAKYLEENFDVKFMLQTIDGSDATAVIAGTENAVAMGANAVITTIADGLDQACRICQEYGVGFGMAYVAGDSSQREIMAKYDNNLGTFCSAIDGYAVGAEMANTLIDEGKDNFAMVTFIKGLLEDVDTRTSGFMETAEERGANVVYKLEENPGSSMITAVSTMLDTYGDQIEYIIAYGGGTNFVAPALTASNYDIPIAVPTFPDDYEAYFESGVLDYVVAFNDDIIALAFAAAMNYINGQQAANTPNERIYECANVVFRNIDEAKEFDALVNGEGEYTFYADELKNVMTEFNPDASYEDLIYLAETSNLSGIKERHGK